MYQVLVNGNSIKKIQNTKPVKYQNVKIWASRGISFPAAVNAKIKDLEYGSKYYLTTSPKRVFVNCLDLFQFFRMCKERVQ